MNELHDLLDLTEVYGLWHTSFWSTLPGMCIVALGLVSAIALMGFIIWYFWLRQEKIDNWTRAMQDLAKLQHAPMVTYNEQKNFYQMATDVFKTVLAQCKTGMPGRIQAGITDSEIIERIQRSDQLSKKMHHLLLLFTHAMRVKFNREQLDETSVLADQQLLLVTLKALRKPELSQIDARTRDTKISTK